MALFKCKMCGGNLEIAEGVTVAECEYCGARQTVPKVMDENLQNLFNRANTLRIKSEFDKAEKLYEKIVEADSTQAEAYWGLILCKYGIEYVDDPKTYKKIPTCHRASYDSIIADEDYKSALENADISQKVLYEEQAKEIDRIQKEILALAQKEESYDVFICYKETDANGQRTQDSVIANDIYYQLTNEGFKVFYAAITLEGKLGSAYEPIIFAALNSAKVMLAIGSKPEYFNAVWVKNEWSRFLKIIKKDRSKLLIPCYRDMDAYELPEEFAHLQAQDMSKIGFINDLVRGIKKVIQKDEPKLTTVVKETVVSNGNANAAPLLKRAFIFLEDGDWNSANEYCEKVLDIDPENARAYLGKLMVELNVRKQEDLKNCDQPFGGYSNCQKAVRFADEKLKSEIVGYIEFINNRNEEARLKRVYNEAKRIINLAEKHYDYKSAQSLLESIPGYLDADELAKDCAQKAEEARIREAEEKKQAFERAVAKRKDDTIASAKTKMKSQRIPDLEYAIAILNQISGWKNASELIEECERKIEDIKAQQEAERKAEERKNKIKAVRSIIIGIVICAIIAGVVYYFTVIVPDGKYNDAVALMDSGKYEEAIAIFEELKDYNNSVDKLSECKYNASIISIEKEKYVKAYETLIELNGYRDSAEKAKSIFDKYKAERLKSAKVGDYVLFGSYEQDNNTTNGKEDIEWLVLDVKDGKALVISKYILDYKAYNEGSYAITPTWETCSLRQWLNNEFLSEAIEEEDRVFIPTVNVTADDNIAEDTESGNDTQDKVFLLSIDEAEKYFESDEDRSCNTTEYSDQGVYRGYWWLRTRGMLGNYAVDVYGGDIDTRGSQCNSEDRGVRPAMWIDLSM